jgi:two-component system, sensor histidine kinase and response regulator
MSRFRNYPLKLKLLLVPSTAVLGFVIYLIYSSLVLSGGNTLLKEIREVEFPVLYAASENLKSFEGVVESLNTAAATGEIDYLEASKAKAAEILDRYQQMEQTYPAHAREIEQLKSGFNNFYALAYDIAHRMTIRENLPSAQQIQKMRILRDAYARDAAAYREVAEKEFQETIKTAISRSERAQGSGAIIGAVMLLIIGVLTLLVNRGIVVLEEVVENRNRMLERVNTELEKEIAKLKSAEEARSHAEAASHIKDEFLANMSHELRTPMNAVIGLSHLCLQTELSGKQHDYLQKIHSSAKSLLGILNDILDVSKIEAGKMELDRIPFELNEVMENLSTILGAKCQEKNLGFLLDTADDVPEILVGDPLRLGQVLINLAGNSVKFTRQGEVTVRAALEREERDHVILRFTVKDTGIGLTQQEIDRLFKPFTQADTSITRKFGGTGLGLTISKRLVEKMEGKIWVESAPGLGSKFIFTARFQKAEKLAGATPAEHAGMRGMRVLVVGNEESALIHHLESFRLDVSQARTVHEALNAVHQANKEARPVSLAIFDASTADMNEPEVARELQAMIVLGVKPRVLLIAGHAHSAPMDEKVVDGLLHRPYDKDELFEAIARISGKDRSMTGKFRTLGARFNMELVSQVRGAHMLLVEDNEINQQIAKELLESFGITVKVAENGEEALVWLKDERFDGVLMDMQMPVMDGITATREIRKDSKFSQLPIIALTANVFISEQNQFLAAGMNDHIGKPIDPDQLIATLAKWIHPVRNVASMTPLRTEAIKTVPVKTEPVKTELPDLPGVKVAESLRRIGGSVELYYSLLDMFRTGQKNIVQEIRASLSSNDMKTAERQAHTLKGIAGSLGAVALQGQAEMLEKNFRNGVQDDAAPLLEQMEHELNRLMESIDLALSTRKA